jgi:hypothetical protein
MNPPGADNLLNLNGNDVQPKSAIQNPKSKILYRGVPLSAFYIFVIRAILGGFFAVLLTRFFYPKANIVGVIGFAIGLVGLAYITEYFRKRRKG